MTGTMKEESQTGCPLLNVTKKYVAGGIVILLLLCLYPLAVVWHPRNMGYMPLPEHTDESIGPMALSSSSSSSSSTRSSSSSSSNSTQQLQHQQPHRQQLLLVTQGRSGSSYTSALIAHNKGVFYNFEPLYPLNNVLKDKEANRGRVHGLLKAYLTCDFMNISAVDLSSKFHTRTEYGKTFFNCERRRDTGFIHIQCLSNLVRLCRRRAVSFSKVIRFPMRWAEALLKEIPHLKILYLVRDPRAVIYSQSKTFVGSFKWPDALQPKVTKYCEHVKKDFREIARLSPLYPGRLLLIRYENGAVTPLAYAQNIYKFVGLEFTNGTKAYISSLQSSNSAADHQAFGLKRSNATDVVNKWRHSSGSYKAAKVIDASCDEVYSKAGYIKVASQKEVSSTTKPLFTEPTTFSTLQAELG